MPDEALLGLKFVGKGSLGSPGEVGVEVPERRSVPAPEGLSGGDELFSGNPFKTEAN